MTLLLHSRRTRRTASTATAAAASAAAIAAAAVAAAHPAAAVLPRPQGLDVGVGRRWQRRETKDGGDERDVQRSRMFQRLRALTDSVEGVLQIVERAIACRRPVPDGQPAGDQSEDRGLNEQESDVRVAALQGERDLDRREGAERRDGGQKPAPPRLAQRLVRDEAGILQRTPRVRLHAQAPGSRS